MADEYLLTGKVLWCYEHELTQANTADEFRVMLSFALPLHYHAGTIALTNNALLIAGDTDLHINLNNLEQLYMGYDEHYKRMYVKNGGLFWQPLKLSFAEGYQTQSVYLVVDYNWLGTTRNQVWFETLKSIFE